MLAREYLRENADQYRVALKNRGATVDIDRFLKLDAERRRTIVQVETLKNQRNVASQEIAQLKKNKQDASSQIEAMKRVGDDIKALDERLAGIEEELRNLELDFPNVPHQSVPVGSDESANRVERTWGEKPKFAYTPKPHWDIGEALGVLDFDRAAKITGARFTVLYLPPFLVNADSLRGTGQLPKFEDDLFKTTGEKPYYLVPTAEVPVTNLHRDEFLDASRLTLSYTAYTPCFRAEAGAAGRDTRGLIRQHQFEKVELVKFAMPDRSWDELEKLTRDAEAVLQALNIHYRVVALSTGDMGPSSAKTYDLEVWLPGQDAYREISSCTNFLDYQARRANIRYRTSDKKTGFVHTLNGSGLALGRTLVAILENCQQPDGSVVVPRALGKYMDGMERITSSSAAR